VASSPTTQVLIGPSLACNQAFGIGLQRDLDYGSLYHNGG
jgi:hypothetical protein